MTEKNKSIENLIACCVRATISINEITNTVHARMKNNDNAIFIHWQN